MSTVEQEQITGELVSNQIEAPIRFSVTNEAIHFLRKKLTGLTANSPTGYKAVQAGIAETRMLRSSVESTRKALKEKALTYGRLVDGEAKRITSLLEEIEEPLKLEKQLVDEAKEAANREAKEAKKRELTKRVDALRELEHFAHPLLVADWTEDQYTEKLMNAAIAFDEKKKAEEAMRLKAIADEAARVETLRIEREAFEAQRSALAAEKAEYEAKQAVALAALREVEKAIIETKRAEQEALAAERAELQKQRDEILERERIERERIWVEENSKYEAEVTAKAERERLEEAEAEAARLESFKPDIEKIRAFGDVLRLLTYPDCVSSEAKAFVRIVNALIGNEAQACEEFLG